MKAHTIEQWLSGIIGLDVHILGPEAVARAVSRRMAACGLSDENDYLKRLNTAPDELPALVEIIVVPETWFFRDREPFVFLAQYAATTWRAAHPHDRLQILSAPCSSGEEPYSIVMALQTAGFQPDRYRIDAVDINPALLRKAEQGVYGPNSFRGGVPEPCERYFRLEGSNRIVGPEARAGIRFIQSNIMGPAPFAADHSFDIIFCRNLLIYQHAEARRQIVATLDRLLKPEGLLFVGHAEMMDLLTHRYEPVRHSGAFAYCKIKAHPGKAASEPPAASREGGQPCPPKPAAGSHGPVGSTAAETDRPAVASSSSAAQPRPTPDSRLDRVRALADQGRLHEAAALGENLLKENPVSAEAHFLLGMIRLEAGQVQAAEECLNRALYLDPDCYEALIHLALLKARRGDEAGAECLRRRAERIHDPAKVTL